jgi:hypothetical protein
MDCLRTASYDKLTLFKEEGCTFFRNDYTVTQRRIPEQQNFRLHTRHNRTHEEFPFK